MTGFKLLATRRSRVDEALAWRVTSYAGVHVALERQLEALSRDGWRVVGVLQDAPDLAELLLMRADAAPAVS